eukprot:SAG22_NODE_230_length_14595_cov_50.767660_2_plen_125_part_00
MAVVELLRVLPSMLPRRASTPTSPRSSVLKPRPAAAAAAAAAARAAIAAAAAARAVTHRAPLRRPALRRPGKVLRGRKVLLVLAHAVGQLGALIRPEADCPGAAGRLELVGQARQRPRRPPRRR